MTLPKIIAKAQEIAAAPYVPRTKTISPAQAKRLNKGQLDVLKRMLETGKCLVRQPGGVWVLTGTYVEDPKHICKPSRRLKLGTKGLQSSDWCVRTFTVEALEARGLIQRANTIPDEWKDDRVLTEAGRQAAQRGVTR